MTDTPLLPLAAAFDPPDESRWHAMAEAALKGAPWERLVGRTADGLAIKPLYRAPDLPTPTDPAGLPGQAPFTRGVAVVPDPFLPWDIRQIVTAADGAAANAIALEELGGGVSSLDLAVAPADIAAALAGVRLDIAPVGLAPGWASLGAAEALANAYRHSGAGAARPAFNLDPFGPWISHGGADQRAEQALTAACAFAVGPARDFPAGTALKIDARRLHEAGASPAWELAAMLSLGVAALRGLETAGLPPTTAARTLLVSLAVGPDPVAEIAKLRAARRLWAELLDGCGVAPADQAVRLHAVTSARMMTALDPWTNILRTTAAAFAAAAAGVEALTVLPFTTALGAPAPLARRLARNTQLIVMEECGLGRVADPAGGAFAVEAMTEALADAAWRQFTAIEAAGGIIPALRAGLIQRAVAETRAKTATDIARRKQTLTGLTDFPLLDAALPAFLDAPAPPATDPSQDPIEPLPPGRWAEPVEALRARAEAKRPRPQVFIATLGPLAAFSPRANFTVSLLAMGGVGAIGAEAVHDGPDALVAAFSASGAAVAALAGSDADYAAAAAPTAAALKSAGAVWVIYAGRPGDEAALRAAGVDQFIYAGQDALDALSVLHAALGIT